MPQRASVTVMRGNPLPLPGALLLAAGGAVPLVLAFFFDFATMPSNPFLDVVLWTVAAVIAIFGWLLAIAVARTTRRADAEPDALAPDELAEPPSDHDAAQVAVLDGLRSNVDASGEVVGPPVWKRRVPWWRGFAREAPGELIGAGLVEPSMPLLWLIIGLSFTVVAVSIPLFNPFVFVGIVPFFIGVTHALANLGGYRMPQQGRELRARWAAYARYLAHQGSVHDVGPAAIAIWGPNLYYGAVRGQAENAARPLTPGATEEDIPTPFETLSQSP